MTIFRFRQDAVIASPTKNPDKRVYPNHLFRLHILGERGVSAHCATGEVSVMVKPRWEQCKEMEARKAEWPNGDLKGD